MQIVTENERRNNRQTTPAPPRRDAHTVVSSIPATMNETTRATYEAQIEALESEIQRLQRMDAQRQRLARRNFDYVVLIGNLATWARKLPTTYRDEFESLIDKDTAKDIESTQYKIRNSA